jgi:hypothetical protein
MPEYENNLALYLSGGAGKAGPKNLKMNSNKPDFIFLNTCNR